jgi:hypothetical protein
MKYRIKENKVNGKISIEGLIETKILFFIKRHKWEMLDAYGNGTDMYSFIRFMPFYKSIDEAKKQIELWKNGTIIYHEV